MTKDITREQRKEISQAWYDFMERTIQLDTATLADGTVDPEKNVSDQKPRGWHWFWGIYCLRIKVENFPIFDFETIQNKLPDGHWLKKISIDFVGKKPIGNNQPEAADDEQTEATDDKKKETPDDLNKEYATLVKEKTFNNLWKVLEKYEDSKEITKIYFSGFPFECDVDFSNCIFPIDVSFEHAKFFGEADFRDTLFFKDARFNSSEFLKDARFDDAVFLETADFKKATFHEKTSDSKETAKFRNTIFEKIANFKNATFWGYANFKSSKLKGRAFFQKAKFKYHAPRFYGAKFNNEITWAGIQLPDFSVADVDKNHTDNTPDDGETCDEKTETNRKRRIEENQNSYENTAILLAGQDKYHDQHFFFREEMRCRRELEGNALIRWAFGLYEGIADYGYGIERALEIWFCHIVVGASFISIIASYGDLGIWQTLFCSISTSIANANPFVFVIIKDGSLKDCYECLQDISPLSFGAIRGFQTFIGVALLFLLLTTLRVRFRLK